MTRKYRTEATPASVGLNRPRPAIPNAANAANKQDRIQSIICASRPVFYLTPFFPIRLRYSLPYGSDVDCGHSSKPMHYCLQAWVLTPVHTSACTLCRSVNPNRSIMGILSAFQRTHYFSTRTAIIASRRAQWIPECNTRHVSAATLLQFGRAFCA